jgi:hypothetical protein
MFVLLIMWSYTSTPVATISFNTLAACQKAAVRMDNTYGDNIAVLRCFNTKTGDVN